MLEIGGRGGEEWVRFPLSFTIITNRLPMELCRESIQGYFRKYENLMGLFFRRTKKREEEAETEAKP